MLTKEQVVQWDEQVKEIGKSLGMEFDQQEIEKREYGPTGGLWNYRSQLKNGTKRISFHTGDYKHKDRWQIHAEFPRDAHGQLNTAYNTKWPEITVSMTKEAEKIAKDIKSRLLPEYELQLAETIKRNEEADNYRNGRLRAMQTIADFLGVPRPTNDQQANIYPERGCELVGVYKIEPYSEGKIKMDVECSPEKAIEILKLLGY